MSASARTPGRGHLRAHGMRRSGQRTSRLRGLLISLVVVLPLLSALAGIASADPQVSRSILSADAARRAGVAIQLQPGTPASLLEVALPVEERASAGRRLLAVSPSAAMAAVVSGPLVTDRGSGTLAIARADGSQIRVGLPGLLAAGFAPDETWLAVLDGGGRLWRVSTADGTATVIAAGPFLGPLTVEADGGILLQAVASVDAPFRSIAVRVDATGEAEELSDARLVYGVTRLASGDLALVVRDAAGTHVRIRSAAGESTLADLGQDAVNVAVARDTSHVAFQREGEGVLIRNTATGGVLTVPEATHPRFAPDGSSLLVTTPEGGRLLSVAGAILADLGPSLVAFPGCGECRP